MRIRCHYWGQGKLVVNLGDALVPILLNALGHDGLPTDSKLPCANPGRQLLVIGSLLDDTELDRLDGPIDVWGCGWRGKPLSARNRERLTLYAVRGPLTVKGLELPPTTVIGDPAWLTPQIIPAPAQRVSERLVMPHCLRTHTVTPSERLRSSGADALLSPWVLATPHALGWRTLRQAAQRVTIAKTLPHRTRNAVQRIASAQFVLTGSLHGAILCHAYGTPWAAYDDQGIDSPSKWHDLAALMDMDIAIVKTIRAGERWWQQTGHSGQTPDIHRLLKAFPYPTRSLLSAGHT